MIEKVLGEWLTSLVALFGPVGAALLVVAILAFLIVRALIKWREQKARSSEDAEKIDILDRVLTAFEENGRINADLASSNAHLAATLDDVANRIERHEVREREALAAVGPMIEHSIRAGFNTAVLPLLADRRRQEVRDDD